MKKKVKQVYKDSKQPVEKRVKDLLNRMTVEEKICQLSVVRPEEIMENGKFSIEKAKKNIGKSIGGLTTVIRDSGPRAGGEISNEIQKFLVEKTRLGIPAIIHDECLHGCMARESTSFPQSIALASTWDVELMERISTAIGKETRTRGIHQALSPTINITRDSRCGRTEETYGEDPYLTSKMAVAFIKGIQGQGVVATPKHFIANFVGDGGRDSNAVHFSERLLREIYFPAFKASIMEANALSLMSAYGSSDGMPCSCSKWLLTDILRKEWGFKGLVVSDYGSVDGIHTLHKVADTPAETAKKALEAGLDMELPLFYYYKELIKLAKTGKISKKVVDASVARILRVKFWLGLFDNPYVNPEFAVEINNCDKHKKLALEASRKSIILFKNDGILPLKKDIRSIAVIGPNANVPRLGGYSVRDKKVVVPFEGIKNKISGNTEVFFAEGCKNKGDSKQGFDEAVSIAKKSDLAILFMGNSSGLGWLDNQNTEGEQQDRCNLDLPGVQEDLIKETCNTGVPVIVVLIGGSAVTMTKWLGNVKAVVEAWYPGEEGGNAIADVLFGDYNPGGKLPITFPKFTGQLPLYYNYKPTGRAYDYIDCRGEQELFPFGYGLSYTKFEYSNLEIRSGKKEIKINVNIENTGEYEGDEVVLLFIKDEVSSLSRPVKELKGFKRITLKPGEKKNVGFILLREDLSFLNEKLKPVVEPGSFLVMVGNLTGKFNIK